MAMRETKGLTEIKRQPGQSDSLRRTLNRHSLLAPTAELRCRFGRGLIPLIDPPNLPSANIGEVA